MRPDTNNPISDYPVKPRKTKGTYTYRGRNYVAAVGLLGSCILGLGYMFLPTTQKILKLAERDLFVEDIEAKIKRDRLAPFSKEVEELKNSPPSMPVIINPSDSKTARASLSLIDPLRVQPGQ